MTGSDQSGLGFIFNGRVGTDLVLFKPEFTLLVLVFFLDDRYQRSTNSLGVAMYNLVYRRGINGSDRICKLD
ncbi:hypothetical protein J53TS2_04150 [Paenibacillus sp. J53TS2]|nr:hypothetical protein J53TS2_04150 [Paenibacillus sp. J53TS2]